MNDSELQKAITKESKKIHSELTMFRDYDQDNFQEIYQKNKEKLTVKGIDSFSDYVTYMLKEMMQTDETFTRYAPKIEKISVDDDLVILKDNIKNKIAKVTIQKRELFCQLCREKDCIHVGFVFSLPDMYDVLNTRGIEHPR